MTVEDRIKSIIVRQSGINLKEITLETSFLHDLGVDSLEVIELFMMFEEEFNVEIPNEDAEKMHTVGDAVKYIEEKTWI